jgi:ubiquitin-conjugating enzyme (huntingtin interacting protein 2)
MTSNRNRRIAKEIADIHNDQHSKIVVEPAGNGEDLTHLRGQFFGPPDTPYEGATYHVDIRIPSEYPFRPPLMKFETKIWHPNVSSQTVRDKQSSKARFKIANSTRGPSV